MIVNSKIQVLKETRNITQKAFEKVFREVLESKNKISEEDFASQFLIEIGKSGQLFPQGWYQPPPNGVGVLFATDENPRRITFKTLRSKDWWPKGNVYLDKQKGLVVFYFSSVDRKTGIIGDFGKTIYVGKDPDFLKQIENTKSLISQIYNCAEVGMKISNLFKKAEKLFLSRGFINDWWISTTDKTGTNFGHTIPGVSPPYQGEEMAIFDSNSNWQDVCNFISKRRIFFNGLEETKIEPPFALTIEPRLKDKNNPNVPPIYFHTIAIFNEDGKKEHLKPY